MSNNVHAHCNKVASETGFSWTRTPMTDFPSSGTESEEDPTPCGRGGSLKERRCQLFKLTTLAILPGIILIVRDAVEVASDVEVMLKLKHI
ncbi:hypothetical protein DPMN_118972 [Dreissena polymorpha]|uniref:Uncharacterized protein n=1 Tax=Dreissena polymorpha TaxID=45954 RepID=A0A9D4GL44_DREPO|nr:hypothetical protein DPMN_118972 [Dreissena polymorpha]